MKTFVLELLKFLLCSLMLSASLNLLQIDLSSERFWHTILGILLIQWTYPVIKWKPNTKGVER